MSVSTPFLEDPRDGKGEARAMLALAGPLVAANLLQMLVYAVDVVFVARLGDAPLSASSLGTSLYGLLIWTSTGLVSASAPLIAAELGKRRHAVREVRRTMRMTLWLGIGIGLLAMLVCAGGEALMLASGQQAEIAHRAGGFLAVLKWGAIPMILAAALRIFVSALGRPVIGTAITLLALLINCVGNYALVFGHLGAPAWGLEGSALSSVLTSIVMLGAYGVVIARDRRLRRYHLFGRWWRGEWARLRDVLRIGLPIAITILAEAGLFGGAAFLMGRIGPAQLAGHTVALQLAALAFQVPFGVAQAATIRVGHYYGRGDQEGIAHAGRVALMMGMGFMVLSAGAMMLFPRLLLAIYIDPDAPRNAAMVGYALQFLVAAAAFQLFDGAQAVGAGVLRGLQDTRIPMLIAIFGYWIPGMGTAVWLGFFTPLSGLGIWIGLLVGLVFVSALLLWRWHRRAALGLLPLAAAG